MKKEQVIKSSEHAMMQARRDKAQRIRDCGEDPFTNKVSNPIDSIASIKSLLPSKDVVLEKLAQDPFYWDGLLKRFQLNKPYLSDDARKEILSSPIQLDDMYRFFSIEVRSPLKLSLFIDKSPCGLAHYYQVSVGSVSEHLVDMAKRTFYTNFWPLLDEDNWKENNDYMGYRNTPGLWWGGVSESKWSVPSRSYRIESFVSGAGLDKYYSKWIKEVEKEVGTKHFNLTDRRGVK